MRLRVRRLFSSEVQPVCPVPTGDGGYYPLYWCAREARERSARTPYTVARQCGAVRRDPRAARARTPRTAAPRVSDRLSVRKKMLCRAQGSQCCWFVLKPNKYLVLTPCAPRRSRARAGSPPCPDRRSRCGLAGAKRGPQITPQRSGLGECVPIHGGRQRARVHTQLLSLLVRAGIAACGAALIIFCASAASSAQACRTARA